MSRKTRICIGILILFALALLAGHAKADELQYSIVSPDSPLTVSFDLNTASPLIASDPNFGFEVASDSFTLNGSPDGSYDIAFYAPYPANPSEGGGLQTLPLGGGGIDLSLTGDVLYTGTESNPIYSLGTFNLNGFDTSDSFVLTVTDLTPTATPEPSVALLLMLGMGGVAFALRRIGRG